MKQKLFIPFVASALIFASCDKSYDLKNLDKKIDVAPGLEFPVAGTQTLEVGKLLDISENEYIKINDDGDYYIKSKASSSFKIKIGNINTLNKQLTGNPVKMNIPGTPSVIIPGQTVDFPFESLGNPVNIEQKNIPADITDIMALVGAGNFTLDFNVPNAEACTGFYLCGKQTSLVTEAPTPISITYPEWLFLEVTDDRFEKVEGKNELILKKDIEILAPSKFSIAVKVTGIEFTKPGAQFDFDEHKIKLDGIIDVKGKAFISSSQLKPNASAQVLSISLTAKLENFVSEDAIVKLNPDLSGLKIDPVVIDHSQFPKFLTGETALLDLSDSLNCMVELNNDSPLVIYMNTGIQTTLKNAAVPSVTMDLDQFIFEAEKETSCTQVHSIYDTRESKSSGKSVSLFRQLPTSVQLVDFKAECSNDWVHIKPNSEYSAKYTYQFDAPLSFGKDLAINYEYNFQELNFKLKSNVNIHDFTLHANVTNNLPFDIKINPTPLDAQKQPIPSDVILPMDEIIVKSGSTKPQEISLEVKCAQEDGTIPEIGGMLFSMFFYNGNYGNLNKKQKLEFTKMYISTETGLIINMEK